MGQRRQGGPYDTPWGAMLDDGTLARQPMASPGPLGTLEARSPDPLGFDDPASQITELKLTRDRGTVLRIAEWYVGQRSFSVGTAYGIGEMLVTDVIDLVTLLKQLVLADLYDRRHNRPWYRPITPLEAPQDIMSFAFDHFFEEELREAHAFREELIAAVSEAVQDPRGVLRGIKTDYAHRWSELQRLRQLGGIGNQFSAGQHFGSLLSEILLLVAGGAGVVVTGAKLAAKVPRLARALNRLNKGGGTPGKSQNAGYWSSMSESEPSSTIAARAKQPKSDKNTELRQNEPRVYPAKQRIALLAEQGHGPQRHEGQVTVKQLDERARLKYDPETGSRQDKYKKKADGTPANHRCRDHATKVNSEESYVKAEVTLKESADFRENVAAGRKSFSVKLPLGKIYGSDYKSHVSGRSRTAPWPDTNSPTLPTDFTDGHMIAVYRFDADSGKYKLVTMYPEPKD